VPVKISVQGGNNLGCCENTHGWGLRVSKGSKFKIDQDKNLEKYEVIFLSLFTQHIFNFTQNRSKLESGSDKS